jgi:hypothetical protein
MIGGSNLRTLGRKCHWKTYRVEIWIHWRILARENEYENYESEVCMKMLWMMNMRMRLYSTDHVCVSVYSSFEYVKSVSIKGKMVVTDWKMLIDIIEKQLG